jgi:predicted DNA-binding protein
MPKRHGSKKDRQKLTVVFRPNSDLKEQLNFLALSQNRTMNGQVLDILEKFFKEREV